MFQHTWQKITGKLITWSTLPQIWQYRAIEGFLSSREAVTVYRLARSLPLDSTILEIGSWKGKSTYCLAQGLRSGKVIAIDPFNAAGEAGSDQIYKQQRGDGPLLMQFKNRMQLLGVLDKIEVREGYSRDFVGTISALNLLFIDGDHSIEGCDFDYMNYAPLLASGGILAFHDFDPTRKDLGPTWVVENRVMPSGRYQHLGVFGSLWVGRKS